MTAATLPWPAVRFSPRRLGHVNLYVGDLDRAFAFYHDVCGLELVFDEPGIYARFLSNGNSHHDLAIMQATGRELRGRDGHVQVTKERGAAPGLNHLAFEMDTEAHLVQAIRRGEEAGLVVHGYSDHQISRSVYLPAPDGVVLEIYVDRDRDWRSIYEGLQGELLTERWEPGREEPSDVPQYVEVLDHRPAEGALARPLRTARAGVVTADLPATIAFYEAVVGLRTIEADLGEGRWAVLGGALGLPDLLVLERLGDEPVGFHHFGLELADLDELAATEARLHAAGQPVERTVAHAGKRGLVVRDPDGVAVELFATVPGAAVRFADVCRPDTRDFLA